MLKKAFGFAIVILLLNPHPLISDAQMWGQSRGQIREEKPISPPKTARSPSSDSEAQARWACFHSEQITIEQSEVLYNGNPVSMPQMQIRTENHWYEVSLGGDTQGDYDSIFSQWQALTQGAQNVCLSMEELQALEPIDGMASSLMVVHRFKTDRGEWSEAL